MNARMIAPATLNFHLKSRPIIFAAENRITELVNICLRHNLELIWERNFTKELVRAVVKARDVDSFRLLNTKRAISVEEDQSLMNSGVEISQGSQANVYGVALLL